MQAVGEHDQEGPGRGIDPDRRAGIAGVAIGLRREGRRQPHRVRRIDVPAEAAQGRAAGWALRLRHGRDRGRFQHALAAGQHHLRELREIVGGGESAGMARNAAHAIGDRILDLAPAQFAAFDVGRRDAVPRCGRPEGGVAHAERLEDVLGGVGVQRLARDPPHDLAQHDEVDIAIDEPRAGRRQRLQGDDGVERALGARPGARRDAGRQAGIVRHELADGDVGLAVGGEGRPVGGGRPVEIDLAALDQLHDRHRRRHHLGERSGVVDRVERGGLHRGHHGAVAVGLAHDDAIADAQHDHGARHLSVGDLVAHDGADGLGGLAGRGSGWRGGGRRCRRRAGDGDLADQTDKEEPQRLSGPPWPCSQGARA